MITEISEITYEVGQLLLSKRDSLLDATWEGTQLKSKADIFAHEALTERLKKLNFNIPIISEEGKLPEPNSRPEKYWLIDPIDGTASFVGGYSGFVTQIALMVNHKPILAAVYAPVRNELFTAEVSMGAFLNGKKLTINNYSVANSIIDNYPEPKGITKTIYEAMNLKEYIECGSISLKICKIADGTADIFFKDIIVRDWDIAAPHLLISESGGVLRSSLGEDINYCGDYSHKGLVASSPKVCDQVVKRYLESMGDEKR